MTDLMKHIRSIHYFLIIICGTLFYIGSIAGTQYSLLIAEINQLDYYTQQLQFSASQPTKAPSLRRIDPNMSDAYHSSLSKIINGAKGVRDSIKIDRYVFQKTYLPLQSGSLPNAANIPIDQLYQHLEKYTIEAILLDSLIPEQHINWPSTDGGNVDIIEVNPIWYSQDSVKVHFKAEVYVKVPDSPGTTITVPFSAYFSTRKTTVNMSNTYFEAFYPNLIDFKDQFWMYSINDLRNIARSRMGAAITENTPKSSPINILGIQIQGEHIGLLGILVIFVTLLYLNLYLKELKRLLALDTRAFNEKSILWIGLMHSHVASFFCFASIVILPPATAALLFYRFIWSSVGALFPGVLFLLLGLNAYGKLIDKTSNG